MQPHPLYFGWSQIFGLVKFMWSKNWNFPFSVSFNLLLLCTMTPENVFIIIFQSSRKSPSTRSNHSHILNYLVVVESKCACGVRKLAQYINHIACLSGGCSLVKYAQNGATIYKWRKRPSRRMIETVFISIVAGTISLRARSYLFYLRLVWMKSEGE